VIVLFALVYVRCGTRPTFLSLATSVDGPRPASARRTLLYLHGIGGSPGSVSWVAGALRSAGLPEDVSIVFVEAPFSRGTGRSWGETDEQLQISEQRLQALITSLFDAAVPPSKIYVAGFSQGAGVAADLAAKDLRVGGVASLSACRFRNRPELIARDSLALFIAHGDRDSVCRPVVSGTLVDQLRSAGRQPVYVDFVDDHVIPPTVIRRLVEFLRIAP
jgi:phospholipase/carboxylesterase